jgi:transcription initiation factor IIE alpha subunit
MGETYFYCQACDAKITIDRLALLNEGKCPSCGSIEGFSTASKEEGDTFETLRVINDSDLLEKTFNEDR